MHPRYGGYAHRGFGGIVTNAGAGPADGAHRLHAAHCAQGAQLGGVGVQPVHNCGDAVNLWAGRDFGAVDHDDLCAQFARGADFRIGPSAACVFGHNHGDIVPLHQRQIIWMGKRPARYFRMEAGKGRWGLWRIHQTQQIGMLIQAGKFSQMHSANSQHNILSGQHGQFGRGAGHVVHLDPIIPRHGFPWRAGQGDQGCARLGAGGDGIVAHLRGKGVGGVDHMGDGFVSDVISQAHGPSKATNALRQRLTARPFNAAGKGQGGPKIGSSQMGAQGRGFSRAPQNQKVFRHAA